MFCYLGLNRGLVWPNNPIRKKKKKKCQIFLEKNLKKYTPLQFCSIKSRKKKTFYKDFYKTFIFLGFFCQSHLFVDSLHQSGLFVTGYVFETTKIKILLSSGWISLLLPPPPPKWCGSSCLFQWLERVGVREGVVRNFERRYFRDKLL